MNTKRALRIALVIGGVFVLCYIGYGLASPLKVKARAQRIRTVNAAPHFTMIIGPSNTNAPTTVILK